MRCSVCYGYSAICRWSALCICGLCVWVVVVNNSVGCMKPSSVFGTVNSAQDGVKSASHRCRGATRLYGAAVVALPMHLVLDAVF
jgi:hypothetical protein